MSSRCGKHFARAYTAEIRIEPQSRWGERTLHALAGYGYSARGVILCVIGYFFVRGAMTDQASVVGDTDTAFDFIGGGTIGDTAFALVALGTVAFGFPCTPMRGYTSSRRNPETPGSRRDGGPRRRVKGPGPLPEIQDKPLCEHREKDQRNHAHDRVAAQTTTALLLCG